MEELTTTRPYQQGKVNVGQKFLSETGDAGADWCQNMQQS